MGDFYQNGIVTTLHNLSDRSIEELERELLDFSRERPLGLILPSLFSELEGEALALSAAQLARGACCYDMMYAGEPTAFLHLAKSLGAARCADGRGMLVEQAAESFHVWRGVRPRTAPVIEALGRTLEGR